MDLWAWITTAGWLISLGLVPVLARRYAPAKAWGWMAVMFAAPWLGLILFLLFAENPLGRRRTVQYRRVLEGNRAAERLAKRDHHPAADLKMRRAAIARLAEAQGALPPVGGNAATFSASHEETLEALIRDIDAATHHVHMVFYIFGIDDDAHRVAEALRRAAERGVACRVVADALGSRQMLRNFSGWLGDAGVRVTPAMKLNPLRRRLSRVDVRNHRKIVVIDGRLGYIGSWNVVDPNFRKSAGTYRDLMLRVRGPLVGHLQLLFLEDWTLEAREKLATEDLLVQPDVDESRTAAVLQLVPSGPLYPYQPIRDLTVELLAGARRRVVLTTPYLIPDETMLVALQLAVQRGAEVHVVVPHHSDQYIPDAAGRAYSEELIRSGVQVHCHTDGFLHAKSLTVDDEVAMAGSANFDIRSFRLDTEANVVLYTPSTVRALRGIQNEYLASSVPFDEFWPSRGFVRKTRDGLAKLISPLA